MKQHYKSDEESIKVGEVGFGFSDPTPALPEREGARFEKNEMFTSKEESSPNISERKGVKFETNESITANEADSFPVGEGRDGANKPFTSSEADSLPLGEGWGGVQKPGYITANPYTYPVIKVYRKDLKDHQTEAERVIWEYLRNKKTGHKIRRQHIIGDFITDFVCLSKKVIIEIDGKIHEFQKEQDKLRTIRLNNIGYEVIRFTNDEVLNTPYQVAQKIKIYLNNRQDSIFSAPS